jgi:hypothetical protein
MEKDMVNCSFYYQAVVVEKGWIKSTKFELSIYCLVANIISCTGRRKLNIGGQMWDMMTTIIPNFIFEHVSSVVLLSLDLYALLYGY